MSEGHSLRLLQMHLKITVSGNFIRLIFGSHHLLDNQHTPEKIQIAFLELFYL